MGVVVIKRRDQHHHLLIPLARALFLTALAALLWASAEREGERNRAWRASSSSRTQAAAIPQRPPLLVPMGGSGGGGGSGSSSSEKDEEERDNPRPTTAPRGVDGGGAAPPPATPLPPDLPAIYRHMHEGLRLKGADAEAIAALRPWYRFGKEAAAAEATATTPTTGPALPRLYRDPPHLLGARCTRLVLVKLDDERVRAVAYAVAEEVMREMSLSVGGGGGGDGSSVAATQQPDHYLAKPEELHTTVYHVSHPNSVRGCTTDPNPFRTASAAVSGGERAEAAEDEATTEAPPPPILTQEEWEREGQAASRAVREVAARQPRAALVLERVLLARSGTVLLTWVEEGEGGAMAELRAALRREMPGASPKQPDIMHTTVLRLLGRAGDGDPSLFFVEGEEEGDKGGNHHRARVAALAERLTARFRGTVRVPLFDRVGRIRLASEDRFATVTHEVQLLPVGDGGGLAAAATAATATA